MPLSLECDLNQDSLQQGKDLDSIHARMEQSELSKLPELSPDEADCFKELKQLRLKYPKNITVAYIHINSVRNKFDNFSSLISDKVDILIIAETKIESSFPTSQFTINDFTKPYRLDVSGNSG